MDSLVCVICGESFVPDPRSARQQKCCGKACSKALKRLRDKLHKQRYRETGLGQDQRGREYGRRGQNEPRAEYMRFWRKADSYRRNAQERARAKRYYQKYKARILEKRRQKRAKKMAQKVA
jgi:hypothetical protein